MHVKDYPYNPVSSNVSVVMGISSTVVNAYTANDPPVREKRAPKSRDGYKIQGVVVDEVAEFTEHGTTVDKAERLQQIGPVEAVALSPSLRSVVDKIEAKKTIRLFPFDAAQVLAATVAGSQRFYLTPNTKKLGRTRGPNSDGTYQVMAELLSDDPDTAFLGMWASKFKSALFLASVQETNKSRVIILEERVPGTRIRPLPDVAPISDIYPPEYLNRIRSSYSKVVATIRCDFDPMSWESRYTAQVTSTPHPGFNAASKLAKTLGILLETEKS